MLLEQKILQGSFSTKCLAEWDTKCRQKSRGPSRLALWWLWSYFYPPSPLQGTEVTGLHQLCPLVLIVGRECTKLKVCGAEMRRHGRLLTMPPCVQWLLDAAQPRGAVG